MRDLDTGNILFESENRGAFVASSKIFFVRFRLEVFLGEERVFEHDYDCRGREVLIQFPIGTLGDTLAWFPYTERFREKHGCRVTCAMSDVMISLFKDANPNINFVTHEAVEDGKLADTFYATYSMGLFFRRHLPTTGNRRISVSSGCRTVRLLFWVSTRPKRRLASKFLMTDPQYLDPLRLYRRTKSPGSCKMWHNPVGWREVVTHIKSRGPPGHLGIDKSPVHGARDCVYTHIPRDAEDETGDRPLAERARWLEHVPTACRRIVEWPVPGWPGALACPS